MADERERGPFRSLAHRLAGDPERLPDEGRLPGFSRATGWLNSEPLTPEGLRGRVVLVDFWTYTCVNWLRTLPYLRAWHDKYAASGLTIVGVHTPEFGFEHDRSNVTARTAALGVRYPVAVDDDYGVWEDFANHYWPALYLADADGRLRYHHFGEGEYARTEMMIQRLLLDAGAADLDLDLVMVEPAGLEVAADWRDLRSPETYLGYGQSSGFVAESPERYDRPWPYETPRELPLNGWALSGRWTQARAAAVLDEAGGGLAYAFHARDANLVMGPAAGEPGIPFQVLLDGHPPGDAHGTDVDADGRGTLDRQDTFQLIRQNGGIAERVMEVRFERAGAEAYCFTFG
ncbi:redoxin domain-containing protein [Leifsonia shinshuensis]|uniref:redoxin domain-containing protein n=1 Tax=Leifsonia shinshuensis TaxID=150026 RepID=UPI0028624D5F|nr:redoxin domain-containing protein [Leifsonia shinshuensis]MDR6970382.1 thiol-disulfide isomerase/thioredoxin [Leifsonia shinshuensis]